MAETVLLANNFQYSGVVYMQKWGLAMDIRLASILAI